MMKHLVISILNKTNYLKKYIKLTLNTLDKSDASNYLDTKNLTQMELSKCLFEF